MKTSKFWWRVYDTAVAVMRWARDRAVNAEHWERYYDKEQAVGDQD